MDTGNFKPNGTPKIILQNGQPYGIRDTGGFLVFFPKVRKYADQEERYALELKESFALANLICNALTNQNK